MLSLCKFAYNLNSQLQLRFLRPSKNIIETATNKVFYSSIPHGNQKKGTNNIRKYIVRVAYTSLGISLAYDAFNEFQTIGSVNRFVRSLRIAVKNSFDYSYNLYGLSEESQDYNRVSESNNVSGLHVIFINFVFCHTLKLLKEIHLRCANRILDGCLKNGGLYIKIGQGVSAINHILPKEYTETLKKLEVPRYKLSIK